MNVILRDYQLEVEDAVIGNWIAGFKNILAVKPTGAGKSVLISSIVGKETGGVCVIAHRQELVSQMSIHLARDGIEHRVIASIPVVKMITRMHQHEFGRKFISVNSKVAVAGVDTLVRRKNELRNWLPTVGLWVIDECFPAGTLVDGIPIENVQVGDYVTAFDDETGLFSKQRVDRLFKNPSPKEMVILETKEHHVLKSTKGHPYWTNRGWVNAFDLTVNDEVLIYEVSHVQQRREIYLSLKENRALLLLRRMFKFISFKNILNDNEQNQQKICTSKDDRQQSNEEQINSKKNVGNFEKDWSQTNYTGRQRERSDSSRETIKNNVQGLWFQITNNCKNWIVRSYNWFTSSLQNRLWSQEVEDSNRSRRDESQFTGTSRTRSTQNESSHYVRVASVQVYKSGDNGESGDDYVYNIEVNSRHTYVANSIVVHNCHHVLKTNKWGTAVKMFPNAKGLGVTATPLRLDGKGLGIDSHGVFEEMVVGIGMRELINRGFLTDYKIFAPMASNFNIEQVKITGSGEFSAKEVNSMINQSSLIVHEENKLVGDVVEHYLRLARGKLGITFVPSLDIGEEITAQYNACGVTTVLLNAKTPDNERANIIQRFANREIMQIVNVDILGEGFDLAAIEVVSMARPTNSYGMFVQQFGRALRILEGKLYGLIIDHVGNVARFVTTYGLPDSPKNWSLDPEDSTSKKSKKREINPLKTCESCALVYERFLKACPQCGHYPIPVERNIVQVDGSLQELNPLMLAKLRGDIVLKDRPVNDLVDEYIVTMKQHPNSIFNQSNIKKYRARCEANQEAQATLRDSMAMWGGWRRHEGSDDDEIFKKFYIKFGIDWLTAQALGSKDAINLNKLLVI